MSATVTLADIERLCWKLSGWQVEQRSVDQLLAAVTSYAEGAPALVSGGAGEPPLRQGRAADLVIEDETQAARPSEPLAALPATDDTPRGVAGPQSGVQRIELTGTLTLVCAGPCAPSDSPVAAAARRTGVSAVPGRPDLRRCTSCDQVQPLAAFNRKSRARPTLRTHCRTCEARRKRKQAATPRPGTA